MKEEVFYNKTESKNIWAYLHGIPHSISISSIDYFYLPKRGLEFSNRFGKANLWEVTKLEKIPKKATKIEIDAEKLDKVINAYEASERANKTFGEELSDYQKKHPNLSQSFTFKPKVDPFEYQRKFNKVCKEVFIHSTISKSVNSQ
jgi:hypothetical protein